ncbi:MAG: DUF2029 domain-containing protein [Anaerolineae bacterium]|nr:DUF2029 domain-containing protein [Anaerolineae bacterium]
MFDSHPRSVKLLLYVLVALALLRVVGFVVAFGEESLQMDFSAFYTAGEALNAGLSPYRNHITATPAIWDGVDLFQHSRFLYPPLVATLFQPVALVPYHVAKHLWMIVSLVALFASLQLALRLFGAGDNGVVAGLTALVSLTFHPLLTFLERGQIDSITLLLLTSGICMISRKRRSGLAGVLIAAATLLKLHTLLVVPFLVLRKQWRVLVGYAVGGVLLVLLSLLFCGPQALQQYVTVEFPRISQFGEWGTDDMRVDPAIVESLQPSEGLTVKDGRIYPREYFSFVSNASLVRLPVMRRIQSILYSVGFPSPQTAASVIVFGAFFGVLAVLQWCGALTPSGTPQHEFTYWQLVLVVIMLSAPLTWVMNTVWLLMLLPFTISGLLAPNPLPKRISLVLISVGLLMAAVADHYAFPLLLPPVMLGSIGRDKYVLAELLVVAGLILWLMQVRRDVPIRHERLPRASR